MKKKNEFSLIFDSNNNLFILIVNLLKIFKDAINLKAQELTPHYETIQVLLLAITY
jgi:hypothetical protein